MLVPNENSNGTADDGTIPFDDGEDPGLVVMVSVRSDIGLAWVKICLTCGGEVEGTGGMDVGRVGGGYVRGLRSCKVYKSDTYPSGGARGTFFHNSGGGGESNTRTGWPSSRLIRRIVHEQFF